MADTIRIKRSDVTSAPTTLAAGELAYSEVSGNLFYGRISDGTPVVIGGRSLVERLDGLTASDITDFTSAVEGILAQSSIGDFEDVSLTGAADGQVLVYRNSGFVMEAIPSGVTTFVALTDSPSNYTGSAGYIVKVNSAGNALVFEAGVDGGTY